MSKGIQGVQDRKQNVAVLGGKKTNNKRMWNMEVNERTNGDGMGWGSIRQAKSNGMSTSLMGDNK